MKEEKISFHFGNFMKLSCISYVANESVCECLSPCAYLSFPFVHKQMARCVCVFVFTTVFCHCTPCTYRHTKNKLKFLVKVLNDGA